LAAQWQAAARASAACIPLGLISEPLLTHVFA
jgi:hypothetical protein